MVYKIVSTIKNTKLNYIAVPASWVNNEMLSWPENLQLKEIAKLRSNSKSMPGENWIKITCLLKAKVTTFLEGLRLEIVYSSFTDTKADDRHMLNRLLNKRVQKPQLFFTEKENDVNQIYDNPEIVERDDKVLTPSNQNDALGASTCNNAILFSDEEVLYDTDLQEYTLKRPIFPNDDSGFCIKNTLKNIENSLETRIDLMENRMTKLMAETNIKLEKLLRANGENNEFDTSTNANILNVLKDPLQNVEEIQTLNGRLATDKEFKSQLISQLSHIGGNTRTADGGKLIYKIVDQLFDPELLTQFSWTGSSKSKENKIAFQKYVEIIEVIFEVIYLADCRHSRARNEEFLRDKILKHSSQRLGRKRKNAKSIDENDNDSDITAIIL